MPRKKFIAGNWKMHTTSESARALATAIVAGVTDTRVRVAVAPPFPYLALVAEVLAGSPVSLAAQNTHPANEGAFTGEVSPLMLRDVGCTHVIIGHSERRHGLGESDEFLNRKLHAALAAGLQPIFCVGETLDEREGGTTERVIRRQLDAGLQGFDPARTDDLTIAYEPVWAIGTGRNATPQQAQDAHSCLRRRYGELFGNEPASRVAVLYGGSATPQNAPEIAAQPDVDGALVGGASLKPDLFLSIVELVR
jgi:triosephosphate isomerase